MEIRISGSQINIYHSVKKAIQANTETTVVIPLYEVNSFLSTFFRNLTIFQVVNIKLRKKLFNKFLKIYLF